MQMTIFSLQGIGIEVSTVILSFIIWTFISFANLSSLKKSNYFETKYKYVFKIAVIFSFIFQIIYGITDVFLGLSFEQFSHQWAGEFRQLLTNNMLTVPAFITDIIASAAAYYLFFLLSIQLYFDRSIEIIEQQKHAINFMHGVISFTLLIKIVNIYVWHDSPFPNDSFLPLILPLACVLCTGFLLLTAISRINLQLRNDKTILTLFISGVVFPIIEPLLGNAFQFLGFFILIISIVKWRNIDTPNLVNTFNKKNIYPHQKISLIVLLSISIAIFVTITVHMTAFSPIENMFNHPVTTTAIFQVIVISLLFGIVLPNLLGAFSLVIGSITFLATYLYLIPFTNIFQINESSTLFEVLQSWPSSALHFTVLLLTLCSLVPLILYSYVREDHYGSLTYLNMKKMLKRNIFTNILTTVLIGLILSILTKPLIQTTFDSNSSRITDFVNEQTSDYREFILTLGQDQEKKIQYNKGMSQMVSELSQKLEQPLYRSGIISILAITLCFFFLTSMNGYTSYNKFLKMIQIKYSRNEYWVAGRTIAQNRSILYYLGVCRFTPYIISIFVFFCLSYYFISEVKELLQPFDELLILYSE